MPSLQPWNNISAPNLKGVGGLTEGKIWFLKSAALLGEVLVPMLGGLGQRPRARSRTAYSTQCPWLGQGGWCTGPGCAARRPSTWILCCHTQCTRSGTRTTGETTKGKMCISRDQTLIAFHPLLTQRDGYWHWPTWYHARPLPPPRPAGSKDHGGYWHWPTWYHTSQSPPYPHLFPGSKQGSCPNAC